MSEPVGSVEVGAYAELDDFLAPGPRGVTVPRDGCARIYWAGSHHAKLVRLVEGLRDRLAPR